MEWKSVEIKADNVVTKFAWEPPHFAATLSLWTSAILVIRLNEEDWAGGGKGNGAERLQL